MHSIPPLNFRRDMSTTRPMPAPITSLGLLVESRGPDIWRRDDIDELEPTTFELDHFVQLSSRLKQLSSDIQSDMPLRSPRASGDTSHRPPYHLSNTTCAPALRPSFAEQMRAISLAFHRDRTSVIIPNHPEPMASGRSMPIAPAFILPSSSSLVAGGMATGEKAMLVPPPPLSVGPQASARGTGNTTVNYAWLRKLDGSVPATLAAATGSGRQSVRPPLLASAEAEVRVPPGIFVTPPAGQRGAKFHGPALPQGIVGVFPFLSAFHLLLVLLSLRGMHVWVTLLLPPSFSTSVCVCVCVCVVCCVCSLVAYHHAPATNHSQHFWWRAACLRSITHRG